MLDVFMRVLGGCAGDMQDGTVNPQARRVYFQAIVDAADDMEEGVNEVWPGVYSLQQTFCLTRPPTTSVV